MPGMNERFDSNGLSLACHIARPPGDVRPGPGVILCHGFPIGPLDAKLSAGTFPQLADRIANGGVFLGVAPLLPPEAIEYQAGEFQKSWEKISNPKSRR